MEKSAAKGGLNAMDLARIRERFPLLGRFVYLNHSAIGPLSIAVREAVGEALEAQAEGSVGYPVWRDRIAPLKERIARLIGASPAEIALVRNTVEGLSTVASGVLWREGDNVVTNDMEFPANIYPWMNLEVRYGVNTRLVKTHDGKVAVDDIIAACDERTRLVTVSFVQFSNGYRADVESLGAFCRERGIYFCVDAIQGLGVLRLRVDRTPIDFLASGAHKWLLAPLGIGFLYVRQALQPELWPCEVGHLSVQQNTENYTDYALNFRPSAEKYEGGVHNYPGAFGFHESLKLFEEVGMDCIEERVLMLTDQLCDGLRSGGYRLLSHRSPAEKSGTVSFRSDTHSSEDVFVRLKEAKIITSLREGAIRVAPHFYNTPEEIERFLAALPSHRC
ncbi:MAG: aminotransferase class V-fold PLP-dependent enzyme [bacterium]|nr:aminotransferase class V-fold PLP-dependent enzyme [bacterium]